ncbi:phosphoinositide-3-kinase-interacting protein 1, partial [Callorhinchus milii]|uniref:phosphoinositide-3-kinase-interacting protein 1 n=1 Tax=Callorhinchus milii TaxID=7868 RepID=UPI001C3F9545
NHFFSPLSVFPVDIASDEDLSATTVDLKTVTAFSSEETLSEEVEAPPPSNEDVVVQPVIGISQHVRQRSKGKKDLGVIGKALAIGMMAIIIVLGVGITLGYFYKRGKNLKKQQEQRAYEREMHRITLPLSAFSNPTCELIDENIVVIENAPTQIGEPGEGHNPLIDQAGTPGA